MGYICIDGKDYWLPCTDCKDSYCSSCAYSKVKDLLAEEKDRRQSAEWRIEQELVPRIKSEERAYDSYVTTDRSVEWCDCFAFKVDELVDMFDEDFVEELDFTNNNDIYDKIAQLILAERRAYDSKV